MNKELEMVLPIKIQKEVTTFLHFNYPLCTVLWNNNVCPWLNEHFIQLYSIMHNTGVLWVDMLEKDYFYEDIADIKDLSSDEMKKVDDIIQFTINNIKEKYYATIYTNEFYLPGRAAYQQYNHMHQTLIYGYNLEKKVLIGLGYDIRQRFISYEYPFETFRDAYEKGKSEYDNDFCWVKMHTVYLNKLYNLFDPYNARCELFVKELSKYINGIADETLLRKDVVIEMGSSAKYGIDVYQMISDNLIELEKGNFTIDYRTFHLLAEHKRGLYKKMEYFIEKNFNHSSCYELLSKYKKIVSIFENARLIYLRDELIDNNYQSIIGQLKNKTAIWKVYDIVNLGAEQELDLLRNLLNIFNAMRVSRK